MGWERGPGGRGGPQMPPGDYGDYGMPLRRELGQGGSMQMNRGGAKFESLDLEEPAFRPPGPMGAPGFAAGPGGFAPPPRFLPAAHAPFGPGGPPFEPPAGPFPGDWAAGPEWARERAGARWDREGVGWDEWEQDVGGGAQGPSQDWRHRPIGEWMSEFTERGPNWPPRGDQFPLGGSGVPSGEWAPQGERGRSREPGQRRPR